MKMKIHNPLNFLTFIALLGGLYLLSGCGFKTDPGKGSSSTGVQALGFQGATNLDTGTGMSTTPQIAVQPNGSGTAIAVWVKLVDLDPFDTLPAVYHLFARRATGPNWVTSDSGCPFGNPDPTSPPPGDGICLIDTGSAQYGAWAPKISMDDNGNAIVVWEQSALGGDGTVAQRVYARRFSSGSWGPIQQLNNSTDFTTFNASAPAIAVEPDGGGTAMAVWSQYYQTDWQVSLNTGSPYDSVRSMAVYNGKLYAGMGDNTDGDGDVYVYNPGGGTWSNIHDNGAPYDQVDSMAVYNGKLYVGYGDSAAGDGDVQSYDVTTNTWTTVFDTGIPAANTGQYQSVRSMTVYNGQLYIGTGTSTGNADVYRCTLCDGTDWQLVVDSATNAFEEVTALMVFNSVGGNQLYIGLGITASTDAVVMRCTVCDGVTAGDLTTVLSAGSPYDAVRSMAVYNNQLYVGLGDGSGDGDVMRCSACNTTTDWTTVFTNGSPTDTTYEAVRSMVSYNGFLYIGLGTGSAGDGDIKRCSVCDGTDWTVSLDTGSFEAVFSMAVYDGLLYTGFGSTANTDGDIFSYAAGWQTMARRFSGGWEISDAGVCPTNSGADDGICFISGGTSVTPASSPVVAMDASGGAIAAFIRQVASTCDLAPTSKGLPLAVNVGTFTCFDGAVYVNQFDNITPLTPNWGGANGALNIDPDAPVAVTPCFATGEAQGSATAIAGLTTACITASQPQIAMDRNGNAIVVVKVYWREEEDIANGCGANGRCAFVNRETHVGLSNYAIVNWSGNAIAAMRYASGTSWAATSWTGNKTFLFAHASQPTNRGGAEQFYNCPSQARVQTEISIWLIECQLNVPQIAMAGDASGTALAVWERFWKDASGSYYDVYADCFEVVGATTCGGAAATATDWRSSFPIPALGAATNDTYNLPYAVLNDTAVSRVAFSPQVALDSTGNGMAVWAQKDASGRWRVYGMRFKAGAGFDTTTRTPIDNYTVGDDYYGNPAIAMEGTNPANSLTNCVTSAGCGNAWTLFLESELTSGSVLPALNIRVRANKWIPPS
ncbi:MAG: hypothetical protein HY204_01410 [Nitrospirae bacterium]|nr:hypothetical protein [Nitrospirota bacterium]